jgi:hypothetical protein
MAVALTVTAAFAFATALASFLIAERPVGSDWG